ncbi:uncharacterized protein LOC115474289 isoform X2 [Microcaecilia unicolor]|uniref:Uncharacterized protein LOC115474289 isoform X2 n=1 Tax=Microcaecilia unicolor TaxID=1415580 RepID=A0A6P7YQN5_9AMPH|nr:uncharacterized protein LOC115474289 isoform X2 [Microcaecilia unicolor]
MEDGELPWLRGCDRTFQDVYMSLVQKKKDVFESETEATEKQLCANRSIESSLTIHRRTIVARDATKQKQRFRLEDELCEEINGSHRTTFGASQAGNATFPGCRVYTNRQINKINIEAVYKETNLQIQNASLAGSNTVKSKRLVTNAQCNLSDLVNKSSSIPVIDLISSEDSEDYVLVSSGETHERKEFCKACHKLYNKMADVNTSTIQNIIDPNNWPCSFWIMKYPSSLKKGGQRFSRNLESILKQLKLRSQVPASTKSTAYRGKCSRPHIFLQRNLQLCKKIRKAFSSMQSKQQRKLKQRQSHESSKGKRCQSKVNGEKKKSKTKHENLYVFKVASASAQSSEKSSSEESETLMELVKRKRLSKTGSTRENLSSTKRPSKSRATAKVATSKNEQTRGNPDLTIEKSSKFKHNNSVMSEVGSSSASLFSVTEELGDSDSFAWVQSGSFRDMLDMLNSGHSLSAVVRE